MIKTILYLAHLKDNKHRENDEDILFALKKLGYKVLIEDDREFNMKSILKKAEQADLFLFHKGWNERGYRRNLSPISRKINGSFTNDS
jgi:hypothetical protein